MFLKKVAAVYGPWLASMVFSLRQFWAPAFRLTAARRRREPNVGDLLRRRGDVGQRHAAREPPVQGPVLLLRRHRPRLGQGPSRHGLPLLPRLALRRRPVRPPYPLRSQTLRPSTRKGVLIVSLAPSQVVAGRADPGDPVRPPREEALWQRANLSSPLHSADWHF